MLKKCAFFLALIFVFFPLHESIKLNRSYDTIGQTLNTISMHLVRPIHYSTESLIRCFMPIYPTELVGCENTSVELSRRIISFLHGSIALPLVSNMWLLGGAIDTVADSLERRPYNKLIGGANNKIKEDGSYTFLSLNSCLFWGCLPMFFGGLSPARERVNAIAGMILKENADFVLMQEVSYESACAIWKKIKNHYKYGFTRIGPNFWLKMESGLFVASKFPIIGEAQYVKFPSNSNMSRGLFYFETDACWVFNTHLDVGEDKENILLRKQQMDLIVKEMEKYKSKKPCLLFGDLNITRTGLEDREYKSLILQNFYDPCEKYPVNDETATWTKLLADHAWGKSDPKSPDYELVDYVLMNKESVNRVELQVRLVPTFDLTSPNKCPTDHRGYKTKMAIKKKLPDKH